MLIRGKIAQAVRILNECDIDCWLTFVRESGIMRDPMLDFLIRSGVTRHYAFLIHRSGSATAIVGQLDRRAIEEMVRVTSDGAEYLSDPQRELLLV